MNHCPENPNVQDWLDGELAPAEAARFEAHLAGCEGCTNYVEQMRQSVEVLGHLSEESLAPAVRDELLAVFRKWKEKR